MKNTKRSSKWRWLFWLLVIAFIWVVIGRFPEIKHLAQTLQQGKWPWVLAAAGLQILFYVTYTALYQVSFAIVDVKLRLRDLLPVTFAAVFINSTAPSAGIAGTALFVDEARRHDQPAGRATVGAGLTLLLDYLSFAVVLAAGLILLVTKHNLTRLELVSALILFLFISVVGTVIGLGVWRPEGLRRLLGWVQRLVNRVGNWVKRPSLLPDEWPDKTSAEFAVAGEAMKARPASLLGGLGVGLVMQLVDLASLYCLFLAFYQPVHLGVLETTFAMTMLFWIVSPTPSGIGVVETVMPLVYSSLGIPLAVGTIINLAFRGLTFWIPMFLGFLLLRRLRIFGGPEKALANEGQVRLIATVVALMGIVNVLSAMTPALVNRAAALESFVPLFVSRGSNLTSVLAGFALLLLAGSLWRRKQAAWLMTLVVLLISAVSHIVKGLDYEEATLAVFLALFLLTQRKYFHALSDKPSTRQGVKALAVALIFTLVYGTVGFYLLDRHYSVNFSWSAALRQTVVMFTAFYDPGLQPITGFGRYFAGSIYVVGAMTLGYGLWMLLRPVLRGPAGEADRARAQQIVERYGRSPLARFALFPDKAYYFSPGGSVVAYGVRGGTAVALGDPIGPCEDAAAAIASFRDYCQYHGWLPTFYQTLPDYLPHYQTAGFDALCTGQEAIVDLATFTLSGKQGKPFRNAFNHLEKMGYRAEIHQPPQSDNLLRQLRLVSDEWLTTMHGKEKRFSLGWFDEDYLRGSPIITIHGPDETITAFANVIPEYQKNELTVDLMRHLPNVASGTMDYLFGKLLEWAKEQAYDTFNLGLSTLSGVGEKPEDPLVERAIHFIYEHVDQFYNFKGLHAFKEKFRPHWEPRYLVYPGSSNLPQVWSALGRM